MINVKSWGADDFRLILGNSKVDYDIDKDNLNARFRKYSLESAAHLLSRLLLPIDQQPFITRDASTVGEHRHEHMTVDQGKVVFL